MLVALFYSPIHTLFRRLILKLVFLWQKNFSTHEEHEAREIFIFYSLPSSWW